MTRDEQLHIFEQPIDLIRRDVAVLSCWHRAYLPPSPKRDAEGWYAAIHCPTCNRRRAVVSVIHPKEPRPAA